MNDCDNQLYDVPTVAQSAVIPTCAQLLASAMASYHELIVGGKAVSVKYRDHQVNYTPAQVADLRAYIAQLNQNCPNDAATAMIGRRSARSVRFGHCRGGGCR